MPGPEDAAVNAMATISTLPGLSFSFFKFLRHLFLLYILQIFFLLLFLCVVWRSDMLGKHSMINPDLLILFLIGL